MGVRHDYYWRGYRSGKMLAQDPERDYEGELKLNVALIEARTNPTRAFYLGELRGYRDARGDRPFRDVTADYSGVTNADEWKRERIKQLEDMSEAMRASNAGAWDEA
jgi:hypothetical protein